MEKFDRKKMEEITKSLMFKVDEQAMIELENLWNYLQKRISFLDRFNLDGIQPMTHINEQPQINFLRDDYLNEVKLEKIEKSDVLENAATHDDDYVTINKVVK
ncbi:Asp-tRNA(Asn)/Glu-tRNA(Gln) amidotransferase subunit GatC [Mycoplasma tauri]|uniref:Asp-tRNA(Asn)/Glu-tRNA(Gln) amidotransferase subunit GatC n=1 Tax=Mycoplasma tauri TaxID=547987 RepID=UPI001CBC0784|nr:Asp-tRNA(Asn)/Glu-tRNA(Gln) amidotransferase subunit GatC [Mycoplasma tauri]MBZ4217991.1 glutamyl-tRNA amidotransferase [Mycoplasma tauri]